MIPSYIQKLRGLAPARVGKKKHKRMATEH